VHHRGPGLDIDVEPQSRRVPGQRERAGRPGRQDPDAVRRLVAPAAECGAEVMALGVDSMLRRSEAVELGATIGRGTLLGAPGPKPYA